jgi:tetratricopeptide (TPR) repeat protein
MILRLGCAMLRSLVLFFVVLPGLAFAQDGAHYSRCLDLAAKNPGIALADAEGWAKAGGGMTAGHCAAVALTGLKRYGEAATRLDALARAKDTPGTMRGELFSQAGNAWLLAGDGRKAVVSLQSALTLSGNDPDVYADLGRAEAMIRNWRDAVLHLNAALEMRPNSPELLVLRASAQRALQQYRPALNDLNAALKMKPGDASVLMERGLLRRDLGDLGGARTDFTAAQKNGSPAIRREAAEALDAIKN